MEIFNKSFNILKKKPGGKYNFIVKSGSALKSALFNLFRVIWDLERKPESWRNTVLIQLYKGRGPRDNLDFQRNIHTKIDVPKFFGHIVATAAKPNLIGQMSPYQIGTKPGHRAQEHLFVIKSVIGLAEQHGRAIALQLWDLSKYFDRESLVDGLNELYKNNVRGKVYKLLYEMNKDTRISVWTPVGDTEQRDTGEGWGQGTIEGASCSAVNLDNGVRDFFQTSEYEISYGDVQLFPTLFQDDVSRMCLDPVSAQMANDRMEAMAETKLLDFNIDKSCLIIIGQKKARQEMLNQFLANPPLLYGVEMKQLAQDKYLGDQICSGGLAASVKATIAKRKGKVLETIFDIKAIIDDARSHVTGGITAGLEIWEMAALPYLLNNCDTWLGVTESEIQELDNLQNLFYRVLLQVPIGCPIPMLLWDCAGFLMSNRIIMKKLILLHHIAKLSPDSVAYQVLNAQKHFGLPGLWEECQDILGKFDLNLSDYTKEQWKNVVKKKMKEKNCNDLLDIMKRKYKKIDYREMSKETFEVKPYIKNLHLSEARDKFRLRSFMTRTVKLNFVSDKKFAAEEWSCWHCTKIDSQTHIRICPAYQHLRDDKDLDKDHDLVVYFREVIKLREDMDK